MGKLRFATAAAVLIALAPLAAGRLEAQPRTSYLAPGAAPPWGVTATPDETPTASAPAAAPAAVPAIQAPRTSDPGAAVPTAAAATPMQGTTTPVHAVFLHAGPNGGTAVLGTLHPGEPLRVLASAPGGWIQVESSQGAGWAYGSYLAQGEIGVVEPGAPPPEVISR
jgi:hypothetical protein